MSDEETDDAPGNPEAVVDAASDPGDLDYAWVMRVTFVVTIVAGAPLIAALAAFFPLDTLAEQATFAVRVGALVWFCTAIGVYVYARRNDVGRTAGE